MSTKESFKKIVLSLLIAVSFLLSGLSMFFGNVQVKKAYAADDVVYGTQTETGYYTKRGVVFYAIKVRKKAGQTTLMKTNPFSSNTVETNEYWPEYEVVTKSDGKPYYINYNDTVLLKEDEYILISFARQLPTQAEAGQVVYLADNNKIDLKEVERIYNQDPVNEDIHNVDEKWVKMQINGEYFQVHYQETEGEFSGLNGYVYKYDSETGELICTEGTTIPLNFYSPYNFTGVYLNQDTTTPATFVDKDFYITQEGSQYKTLSQKIDFLTINLEVDGVRMTNTVIQGAESKQFGYVLNLNDSSDDKLVVNEEGLIDFNASYKVVEEGREISDNFLFQFYAFKEGTYNNIVNEARKGTPAVDINLDPVNDPAATAYYSEYFYYFRKTAAPYLIYNHERYEIKINKSIHATSTDFTFSYDDVENKIIQTVEKGVSTSTYYAQEFVTQKLFVRKNNSSTVIMYATEEYGDVVYRDNNGEVLTIEQGGQEDDYLKRFKQQDGTILVVQNLDGTYSQVGVSEKDAQVVDNFTRILFKDIAEYKISYLAVYYKDGNKTYLEALNNSSLRDKITVFGWQVTYKDAVKGQLELESTSSDKHSDFTEYADTTTFTTEGEFKSHTTNGFVTYNGLSDLKEGQTEEDIVQLSKLKIKNEKDNEVPTTNQPPAYFVFNTELRASNSYKIYKLEYDTIDDKYTYYNMVEQSASIYSFITRTGRYLIKIDSVYRDYKSQSGNNISKPDMNMTQYFMFEITNTTPSLTMTKLAEDGRATDEAVLNGKYVKYGVEIEPTQKAGIFDSTTRIKVYKKAFNQANYPTAAQYTISSSDIDNTRITENGNYKVVLEYGIYSASTDKYNNELVSYFIIDNDEITGIKAYNVEKVSGSVYYSPSTDPNKTYTSLKTTNEMFALFWNQKESGAKITASYQLYPFKYKKIKNDAVANDYKLNDWILVDYEIDGTMTSTIPYTKADTTSTIKANNILNDSGLYVFKLTDEAGNVEYFSIIYDTVAPKVLQREQNTDTYVDISRFNYISTNTEIFFGTHKIIKLSFGDSVSDTRSYVTTQLTEDNFIKHIFDENGEVKNTDLFKYHTSYVGGPETLYLAVPITNVRKYQGGNLFAKQPVLADKKNILEIRYIDDRIVEEEYLYYVYDQSNRTSTPSLVYKLTVNTDLSGSKLYYDSESNPMSDGVSLFGTETSVVESTRYMYYRAIADDVVLMFRYKAEPSDVVSIERVSCEYYALEYDSVNRTYKYSTVPKDIALTGEVDSEGYITCQIQMNAGYTSEGKYIIKRIYTDDSRDEINQDYMVRGFIIFVDNEKEIISTPEGSEDIQTGAYAGMVIFKNVVDANKKNLSVTFDEFYRQNQKNKETVVLTTNKLPISISIPYAKYGTVSGTKIYDANGQEVLVSSAGMQFSITSNLLSLENNMYYANLDEGKTFYPYYTAARVIKDGKVVNFITSTSRGYIKIPDITEPGMYTIEVGCIQDQNDLESGKYLQTFFFNFEVASNPPEFDLTANYGPELTQISPNKLVKMEDGNYYTNGDSIVVSWTDPNDNFMAKVNKSQVSYTVGSMSVTLKETQIMQDANNENSYYFTINGPFQDGTIITVTMQYEGEAKYYASNGFRTTKRIKVDKVAPTTNLAWVVALDNSVSGVSSSQLRTVGDRYNKSNTTDAKYRYYSYVFDIRKLPGNEQEKDVVKVFDNFIASFVSSSDYLHTQNVYIQKAINKYSTAPYESWLPVDPMAESNSLFSHVTWKLVRNYAIIEYYEALYSYYEIVEVDAAGNMTIYTIYLVDSLNKVDFMMSYNSKGINATVDENGEYTTVESKKSLHHNEVENIYSRETFNINNIYYSVLGSQTNTLDYSYFSIKINGTTYYRTPFTANSYTTSNGASVNLADIILTESDTIQIIEISNWMFAETTKIQLNVIGRHEELQYSIVKDTPTVRTIGVRLNYGRTQTTSGVRLREEDGIVVKILGDEDSNGKNIEPMVYSEYTIYYFELDDNELSGVVFVITITDNFNVSSVEYVMYNTPEYQNFKGGADITPDIQNNKYIVSSETVYFYSDSLYNIQIKRKEGFSESAQFIDFPIDRREDNGVYVYTLPAPSTATPINGYIGGRFEYLISKTPVSDSRNKTEITVVIYNYMPTLEVRDYKGDDITKILQGEVITSNAVYIYFDNSPQEYSTDVKIVKRGGTDNYSTIATGHRVSNVGTYDIMVSFKSLAYYKIYTFSISAVDVLYYSVITKDTYQTVEPTGEPFAYTEGNKTVYVPYHYIVNDLYEISRNNGVEVELVKTISVTTSQAIINTYIYDVSNYGSPLNSSYYTTQIAITSVPKTNNVLQNSFAYYKGEEKASQKFMFEKASVNVFLNKEDPEDKITLIFNSYYGIEQNKIYYQIAKDGLWSETKIPVTGNREVFTLELSSSAQYQFRFFDKAGNEQVFSTGVGSASTKEYTINFVKSVIFNINGAPPIDNVIYNGEVTISVPTYTLEYYDARRVTLVATLNGEVIELPKVKNSTNTYSATKPGLYEVYFTANRGNKALKREVVSFTIINPNDSRWAFEYVNYNEYKVKSILINGTDIKTSEDMKRISYSILTINTGDSTQTGTQTPENTVATKGFYTITMQTVKEPVQTFTFSFWLNNEVPPITISIEEGQSTTGDIEVKYNARNIYEMVGDCTISITGQDDIILNADYLKTLEKDLVTLTLSKTNVYYIQVYTYSGKLIYSYRVDIVDPLNTITIILIVVGVIVLVVGGILFFTLRKKMKIR